MRGMLVYRPLLTAPDGTTGRYTFEFEPGDAYSFEMVAIAHGLLCAKAPVLSANLSYYLMPRALEKFKKEKNKLFLSWTEVLDIIKNLGYVQTAQKKKARAESVARCVDALPRRGRARSSSPTCTDTTATGRLSSASRRSLSASRPAKISTC